MGQSSTSHQHRSTRAACQVHWVGRDLFRQAQPDSVRQCGWLIMLRIVVCAGQYPVGAPSRPCAKEDIPDIVSDPDWCNHIMDAQMSVVEMGLCWTLSSQPISACARSSRYLMAAGRTARPEPEAKMSIIARISGSSVPRGGVKYVCPRPSASKSAVTAARVA